MLRIPCQAFTLSGLRKGKEDPRHLWPDVARITAEIAPEWVFFENVPGHLPLGLQDVCRDLQTMGYRVAARVVSAAEVGGSHLRDRVFILGHANIQDGRQPGLRGAEPRGDVIQKRSKSDRQPDWPEATGHELVPAVGHDASDGLDGRSLPLFPPVPGDLAQWRETLDRRPDLKPCLHRFDDGVAFGVDRSAAAGNGVVSLAAAHAYCALRIELDAG
jgi:DNA (cytosine-5)-methyltransferase 1